MSEPRELRADAPKDALGRPDRRGCAMIKSAPGGVLAVSWHARGKASNSDCGACRARDERLRKGAEKARLTGRWGARPVLTELKRMVAKPRLC